MRSADDSPSGREDAGINLLYGDLNREDPEELRTRVQAWHPASTISLENLCRDFSLFFTKIIVYYFAVN